jgi:hypothetical protein
MTSIADCSGARDGANLGGDVVPPGRGAEIGPYLRPSWFERRILPALMTRFSRTAKEKADLMHAIYDRITVAGPEIVGFRLTQAADAHGLALALPEKVVLARPAGFEPATFDIPIEGRDEWLPAARRPA